MLGAGAPIANSTVTLWAASAGAPKQVAQAHTDADGRFTISSAGVPGGDASLYLIAKGGSPAANKSIGDNPAIALMSVVGVRVPANVVLNELTTIASVWTHNQFIDGAVIKGPALSLKIAAGNVPNFVNVESGDYGTTIADALNSTETPTLANLGTLANIIAGLRTRKGRCLRRLVQSRDGSRRQGALRHAGGGREHCSISLVPAGKGLRLAGGVLSRPAG